MMHELYLQLLGFRILPLRHRFAGSVILWHCPCDELQPAALWRGKLVGAHGWRQTPAFLRSLAINVVHLQGHQSTTLKSSCLTG